MGQGRPYKVLLNSKEISLDNTYIYPHNIDSIHVDKSSKTAKVLIFTKTKHWESKSLRELIIDSYGTVFDSLYNEKSHVMLFYVDGKLLENISQYRFDKSYFCEASVKDLSLVKGLKDCCNNLLIIDIKLTDKKPEPKVYLRGNENNSLNDLMRIN